MGQHYVARFYLKSWATNGKIYYLDLIKRKIRQRGLRAVANEKLFYRLYDLTHDEIELIEKTLIDPCPDPLKDIHRRFLALYTLGPKLKAHTKDALLDPALSSSLDDEIANAAERYHSRIETCLKPFVSSMLDGDLSFYSSAQKAAEFLYALCVQFTRTKPLRQAAIARIGTKYKGCDAQRIWNVMSHIVATSVGHSLFIDRNQYKPVLIENHTGTPFITGDQPIINLHAGFRGEVPDRLEYYYPLSPTKAMLLVDASNRDAESPISALAVNRYNVLIAKNSYEQVFSHSEEYLETLKKL